MVDCRLVASAITDSLGARIAVTCHPVGAAITDSVVGTSVAVDCHPVGAAITDSFVVSVVVGCSTEGFAATDPTSLARGTAESAVLAVFHPTDADEGKTSENTTVAS